MAGGARCPLVVADGRPTAVPIGRRLACSSTRRSPGPDRAPDLPRCWPAECRTTPVEAPSGLATVGLAGSRWRPPAAGTFSGVSAPGVHHGHESPRAQEGEPLWSDDQGNDGAGVRGGRARSSRRTSPTTARSAPGFALYVDGEQVVDLTGGVPTPTAGPTTRSTLQLVFSSTKGATAMCAHLLAQRGELDLHAPVAEYWPEFAAGGKERHPGGVAAVATSPGWSTPTATLTLRGRARLGHGRPPRSPSPPRCGSPARSTATTPSPTDGWSARSSGGSAVMSLGRVLRPGVRRAAGPGLLDRPSRRTAVPRRTADPDGWRRTTADDDGRGGRRRRRRHPAGSSRCSTSLLGPGQPGQAGPWPPPAGRSRTRTCGTTRAPGPRRSRRPTASRTLRSLARCTRRIVGEVDGGACSSSHTLERGHRAPGRGPRQRADVPHPLRPRASCRTRPFSPIHRRTVLRPLRRRRLGRASPTPTAASPAAT